METLGLVLAVAVFITFSSIIQSISKLLHARLRQPRIRAAVPDELPLSLRDGFVEYAKSELPDGFSFSHYERQQAMEHAIERPVFVALYFDEQENSYIELAVHETPTESRPFKTTCTTLFNITRIVTCDPSSALINDNAGGCLLYTSTSTDLASQWARHLEHVRKFESSCDGLDDRVALSMVEYSKRNQADVSAYTLDSAKQQLLKPTDSGHQLTWKAIKNLFFPKIEPTPEVDNHKSATDDTTALSLSDDSLGKIDLLAYLKRRQLETNTQISFAFKAFAFVLSGLTCGLFMGYVFSWDILWYLLPVLLFHELGHLVAMMVFKYERKFMLFMPIGAFVTGENDNAPTWQRMVVYLAGPVPGILLALGLIIGLPSITDSIGTLVFVLLAINLFNLLPVMPLDGGQLVNLAISSRYPAVQFTLHLLSFLGTLAIALLLRDPFIIIMAAWLGLSIRQSYINIGLIKIANTSRSEEQSEHELVEKLFEALRYTKSNFNDRYAQVRTILSYQPRKSSTLLSSLVMLSYVAAMVGPVWYSYTNFGEILTKYYNHGEYAQEAEMQSRDAFAAELLEYARTPEDKLEAILSAASFPDNGESRSTMAYLNDALMMAENSSELAQYEPSVYSAMFIHHEDQQNKQESERILAMMLSRGKADPGFMAAVAEAYQYVSYSNGLTSEASLDLLEKSLAIYESLGDEDNEVFAATELANRYFETGNKPQAYELMETYTAKTFDEPGSTIHVYRQLAEMHTIDGDFLPAIINITKAQQQNATLYEASLAQQLGWLHLFNGNTELATIEFDKERSANEKEMASWQDDASFLESLAISAMWSDTEIWSPIMDAPYLVAAYLDNDRKQAQKRYAAMQLRWSKQNDRITNTGSITDYFVRNSRSYNQIRTSYNRKTTLIMQAIQYAEGNMELSTQEHE